MKPRLVTVIRQVFKRQLAEALSQAKLGRRASLAHWNQILADAAKPLLVRHYLEGLRRHKRTRKRIAPFGGGMDVFRPEVLAAVDAAAMKFADSTNATAMDQLDVAIAKLKDALKAGLEQGEALRDLTRRVKEIFGTQRAEMIAHSESSRATHSGHKMAARADGMNGKSWLSSSDACPLCLELEKLGDIPIDEPFKVIGSGAYAEIQHAPAHPFCYCSTEFTML